MDQGDRFINSVVHGAGHAFGGGFGNDMYKGVKQAVVGPSKKEKQAREERRHEANICASQQARDQEARQVEQFRQQQWSQQHHNSPDQQISSQEVPAKKKGVIGSMAASAHHLARRGSARDRTASSPSAVGRGDDPFNSYTPPSNMFSPTSPTSFSCSTSPPLAQPSPLASVGRPATTSSPGPWPHSSPPAAPEPFASPPGDPFASQPADPFAGGANPFTNNPFCPSEPQVAAPATPAAPMTVAMAAPSAASAAPTPAAVPPADLALAGPTSRMSGLSVAPGSARMAPQEEADALVRALLALEAEGAAGVGSGGGGERLEMLRASWARLAGGRDFPRAMNALAFRWYQAER